MKFDEVITIEAISDSELNSEEFEMLWASIHAKINHVSLPGEAEACLEVLSKRLSMTDAEIFAICWAYYHKDEDIEIDELAERVGVLYADMLQAILSLERKGILVEVKDGDDVLSEGVMDRILSVFNTNKISIVEVKGAEVEKDLKKERSALDILKNASLCAILSNSWLDDFYKVIEEGADEDKQLAEAIESLEIKSLDSDTQSAFWILGHMFTKSFTAPLSFPLSEEGLADSDEGVLKYAMGNLVKNGLAQALPVETLQDNAANERYVLTSNAVEKLFRGHDEFIKYSEIGKLADVVLTKVITPRELFFSEETQCEIDNLRKMLSPDGFNRATAILKRQKRNPAIISLLYGPPGTGKTESIKQLALESGRDLFFYSAAKNIGSAWGESEKNITALFLGYSYICAISDNPGILVLNECDQLLAKRITNIERSIDKSENAISNIVLQAFEDMKGICLCTTNLAANLDSAFERRFLFRTQLTLPDAAARQRIWKSNIPELKDAEAKSLAEEFSMTGAQIANVVAKRGLAELYYEGDRGYDYIVSLCKKECEAPVKGASRKIGY